jgi:Asp-tRNA(Asn)/Glu-tRNA(Gln) amidotransferase A subunit family amidase
MWTLLHLPTINRPVRRGTNGMPIGVQLLARRRADRHLFAHAVWARGVLQHSMA